MTVKRNGRRNGDRRSLSDFRKIAETVRGEHGIYIYVTSRPEGKRTWTTPLVIGLN